MVKWQLDRLIGQLVLVGDHAADTTCPCTFGYSDPTGRYASETCIPKHLLTIDAYCVETIPMIEDEKLKEILEQISSDAREIREKEIDKLCGKEVEQTDITSWSRDKRKILEPFIYSFACEIPEGEKTGMIYCCESKTKPSGETWIRCRKNGQEMDGLYPTREDAKKEAIEFCHVTEGGNPVYKTEEGYWWGSQGPFPTREKALEVSRAAFASGYKGHHSDNPADNPGVFIDSHGIYHSLSTTGQQPTGIAGGEVLVRNLEPKLAEYEAKIRKAIVEPDELNPGKMKLVKEEKMSDNPGETLSKGGRPRKEPPPEPGKITRQLSAIPIKVDGEEIMPFLEYHCPSPSKGRCVIIPGAKGRAILACGHDIDGVSRYAREEHPNIKDAEESVIGYCKHGVPLGEVRPHIRMPSLREPKITEIEELVK